jgi:hypothetical protein
MPTIKKTTPPQTLTSKSNKPVKQGVLARIEDVGFDDEDGITVCLYGRSGTGKTTFWSTFPSPILAMICSGNERSGELRSVDTPANRKRIKTVTLKHSGELAELVNYQAEEQPFRTVVLDHATGLQDLTLKEILGLDEIPVQKSWGLASRDQYSQSTVQCKELMRAMLNLRCNVVIVAQERNFGDESQGEIIAPSIGAALTPSLAMWLHPTCDYVLQTFIRKKLITKEQTVGQGKMAKVITQQIDTGKVEYCLRTAADAVYASKFRLPKGTFLPDVIVDPDYDKIYKLIKGQKLE